MKNFSHLRWLWLSLLVVLIDQFSKFWIITHYPILVLSRFLPIININPIRNTGVSFGFLSSAGDWKRWVFILIAVVISILIIRWMTRLPKKQSLSACGLSLIVGGAIGNMIDRLMYGSVVDFIDLHIGTLHFPAYFNIADAAINIGVVLWLAGILWQKKTKHYL